MFGNFRAIGKALQCGKLQGTTPSIEANWHQETYLVFTNIEGEVVGQRTVVGADVIEGRLPAGHVPGDHLHLSLFLRWQVAFIRVTELHDDRPRKKLNC